MPKEDNSLQTSDLRQYLKKVMLSLFIVCSLWLTIYSNLSMVRVTIFHPKVSQDPSFTNFLAVSWTQFNFKLSEIGYSFGIRNIWNMFTIVDRGVWTQVITFKDTEGQTYTPKLPYSANTLAWKDELINFREAKLFQSLLSNTYLQEIYANYLCENLKTDHPKISSIQINRYFQAIDPPNSQTTTSSNFICPKH